MPAGRVDAALRQRLEELESKHGDTVRIADIAEVVESMMATLKGDVVGADLAIYAELESLARYMQAAKTEIARLRPDQVKEQYLPAAADQLDAIVEATAEATHTIMDATETIEGVVENLDGDLMHGPQLPEDAKSQGHVDALLASFD